ncbi:MAG TPA: HIT family protein [Dermatophilaceae bacterium]|nr:HIT family protein [Dermatophilaceae bacterium]
MPSVFSRIIAGELPGRFVWQDEVCVAFLSINPVTDGHTLVVSRTEVDRWTDADEPLVLHLMSVARLIGGAQQSEWDCPRPGLLIQGFEIPHLHVHVWPTYSAQDFDLRRSQLDPDPRVLDESGRRLRGRLRANGLGGFVPDDPR